MMVATRYAHPEARVRFSQIPDAPGQSQRRLPPEMSSMAASVPDVLDLSDADISRAGLFTRLNHHAKKLYYLFKKVNLAHPACLLYRLMDADRQYRLESRVAFAPQGPYTLNDVTDDAMRSMISEERLQEVRFPAAKRTDNRATFLSLNNVQPTLYGWHAKAKPGKPTVVFANGKAGSLAHVEQFLKPLVDAGFGFFAFDYRGYGASEGKPDEAGLSADLMGAVQYLNEKASVPSGDIVLWGFSIGTSVVADVAGTHPEQEPFRAVILHSTFDSGRQVVRNIRKQLRRTLGMWAAPLLKMLPPEAAIQQGFDTIEKIPGVQAPLLMLHGEHDWLAPYDEAKRVFEHATGAASKQFVTVTDGRHWLKMERIIPSVLEYLETVPHPDSALTDRPAKTPRQSDQWSVV